MQSIRRKCPEPTGFIGNQCKLYTVFIYLENIQPTGFHWRSMQSVYTQNTQNQLESIGDQCKIYTQRTHRSSWIPLEINAKYIYIHRETQKLLDSTGSQQKIWAESTRSPLFLEISETDCCADYVYYLSNTLLSGSHRRSMLNETLTENARSQSCRPVSGAAVPRLPRGQSMGQGSMA